MSNFTEPTTQKFLHIPLERPVSSSVQGRLGGVETTELDRIELVALLI